MSVILGEHIVLRQENGPDVTLSVRGDEFYAKQETQDGYTVVYDDDAGLFCYAGLRDGQFVSTGVPLSKQPPLGTRKHLQESDAVRAQKFAARYETLRPGNQASVDGRMRTFGPNDGLLNGRRVSEGPVLGLTVLVEFQDERAGVTREDVDELFNKEGYDTNNNFGSVRDYFRLVSSGKLDYRNRVVGPVRLRHNRSHYERVLFVEEAMDLVNAMADVDLSDFDSRNEGVVDAVNFLYAGRTVYGINGDNRNPSELWPHNSVVRLRYGNMKTHFYMLASMGRRRTDLSIGTICHESGHLLCRFPDIYDYGNRDGDSRDSRGIGPYCLMGSGNHLDRGRTPAPICAYLRDLVGWTDDTVLLNDAGAHELPHGDYNRVWKYETADEDEYFMVENRTQQGLDAHLPAGGLAVYHCDRDGSNEHQGGTATKHYQCALIQADGRRDLENDRPADRTDLFAAQDGVAMSGETTPSSRTWDGSDSGLQLSDVATAGEKMTFRTGAVAIDSHTGGSVEGRSDPDLLIPDQGTVQDSIALGAGGAITALQVSVDITHTYRGDLKLELRSPAGTPALLSTNDGNPGRDLVATFDSADGHEALAGLVGEAVAGNWTLRIADLAKRDVGRLNSWTITVAYASQTQTFEGASAPDVLIPDNDAVGVSDAIPVAHTGALEDVSVGVEIKHSFVGDLRVELVAPTGVNAILHNRTGGPDDDISKTYTPADTQGLADLIGQPVSGDWLLRIRDLEGQDIGRLTRWNLKLSLAAGGPHHGEPPSGSGERDATEPSGQAHG